MCICTARLTNNCLQGILHAAMQANVNDQANENDININDQINENDIADDIVDIILS